MSESRAFYLMPKLLAMLQSKKQKKVAICGRGSGKSTYVGWELWQCYQQMPRSLGALYGPTYSQILTKIFPSAKKMLIAGGLKEDRPGSPGHFTIGRKPPPYFPQRPYNEPDKWEYMICLWNGAATEFISADRPDLQRGGSYDYQVFDEAAQIKKDFHDRIAETSLRGNLHRFKGQYRHGMQTYVSSQSPTPQGHWVEDQRYLRGENGEILMNEQGQMMEDEEVFFTRASSWDNVAVLGGKTIRRWKKSMRPDIYDIEVMSKRGTRLPNGFYPGFDPDHHTYLSGAEYDYDYRSEFGIYLKNEDADRDPAKPLLATADFNAVQNSLIVAQEVGRELRFLNEFYEIGTEDVSKWLKPFVDFYRNHKEKTLYLYGDPGGNKIMHMQQMSAFEKMIEYLSGSGWKVVQMVKGKAYPKHLEKQGFINEMFRERGTLPRIRMHLTRCRWLIISLQSAGIKPDFTKDKGSEREGIDQRGATHGSDAFDYLVWYRYKEGQTAQEETDHRIAIGDQFL